MSTALSRTTPAVDDAAMAEFAKGMGLDPSESTGGPTVEGKKERARGSGALPTAATRRRYWTIFGVLAVLAVGFAVAHLAYGNPMPFGSRGFWLIAEMRRPWPRCPSRR